MRSNYVRSSSFLVYLFLLRMPELEMSSLGHFKKVVIVMILFSTTLGLLYASFKLGNSQKISQRPKK